MCTFIDSIPKKSKTALTVKKANIYLSIKPTDNPKDFYRFRLLGFLGRTNGRDYPFIERFTHVKWGKSEDGKPVIENLVTCPVTEFMAWEGDRYSCPICRYANNNYIAYKESGFTDKDSSRKSREFGRKFEALVPVYVIKDPLFDANNGKFRVIGFYDKKVYEKFKEIVNAERKEHAVFNGGEAVDFCIRMAKETQTVNEGKANEYTFSKNVIKMMQFSKNAYPISAITKEAIDKFEFDDQYYVASTPQELQDFYDTYCSVKMDDVDIPTDDDVVDLTSTKETVKETASSYSPSTPDDMNDIDIDADSLVMEDGKDITKISSKSDDITTQSSKKTTETLVDDVPKEKSTSSVDDDIDMSEIDKLVDSM